MAPRFYQLRHYGALAFSDTMTAAIAAAKGGVWKPEYKLWPIPASELGVNVNLTPNPGYGL